MSKILKYTCCEVEYVGTKAELIGMLCKWCGQWVPNNSDSHDGELWPDEFDAVHKQIQKEVIEVLADEALGQLDYHLPMGDEGCSDYDGDLKYEVMDAFMMFMLTSALKHVAEEGLEDGTFFRNFKPFRFKDEEKQKQLDDFLSRMNLGYRLSFADYFKNMKS